MGTAAVAETVAETVEDVAEHMDEVAEVTRSIMGRDIRFLVVGGTIGLAGGIVAGYFLTRGKLHQLYARLANEEIEEMRIHFERKELAREEKPELDRVVKDLGYVQKEEAQKPPVSLVPEQEEGKADVAEVSENVFEKVVEDAPPAWDYATEARNRSHETPYIIHKDEYTENENSYDQVTYTYYEDDDVLADQRDHIIESVDDVVGLENLQKFGHGSEDPSIVYIRNVKLELDFEVVRNPGNFGEQVHGFIKHSDGPSRRRKLRFDDGTSRG